MLTRFGLTIHARQYLNGDYAKCCSLVQYSMTRPQVHNSMESGARSKDGMGEDDTFIMVIQIYSVTIQNRIINTSQDIGVRTPTVNEMLV